MTKRTQLKPTDNPGVKIDDVNHVIYRQVWVAENTVTGERLAMDSSLNILRKVVNEKQKKLQG